MTETEGQKRARKAYRDTFIRRVTLCINRKYDTDVLEHLEKQVNMSAYMKELVRADIRRELTEQLEQSLKHEIEQVRVDE